jgi:hypothetical protein
MFSNPAFLGDPVRKSCRKQEVPHTFPRIVRSNPANECSCRSAIVFRRE